MGTFEKRTFQDMVINLDGNVYRNCSITGCELVYSGGDLPLFEGNVINDCKFVLSACARRTLGYLAALHADVRFRQIVDGWIDDIRKSGAASY